jgi:integrase
MTMEPKMPRTLPKHCIEDKGRIYVRIRKQGCPVKKIRIEGTPWTPKFMEAYDLALQGHGLNPYAPKGRRAREGTYRWLCQQYFASPEFLKGLSDKYQIVMRARLEATFDEPIKQGSKYFMRDCPITDVTKKKVRYLRDLKSDFPEGANNRLKAIRNVFSWGMEALEDVVTSNPAAGVPKFEMASDGFYTWTSDDVVAFLRRHGHGTMARRALYVLLFTGTRCCDAVQLGRQMVRDRKLTFTVGKRRKTDKPKSLTIPVLPVLEAELVLGPQDNLTWLTTVYGHPFKSAKAFGNWFKKRCDEAGLPHCSAHGCRKVGAVVAAENGATDAQMQAIYGWDSAKMAEHYRKKAQQKRLAADAMALINFDSAIAQASGTN